MTTTGSSNVRTILSTTGSSNRRKIMSTTGSKNGQTIMSTTSSCNGLSEYNLESRVHLVIHAVFGFKQICSFWKKIHIGTMAVSVISDRQMKTL